MIKLESREAREQLRVNKKSIVKGLENLAEAFLLEAESEVGKLLPTRIADRYAGHRVRARLEPRVRDFIKWVEELGDE